MSLGHVALAGEMVLRALGRRRLSLALLALLPLAFFAARHQHVGQSIRFLVLGVAWAVSTVAFFAAVSGREAERRLCLTGWSWGSLVAGRITALLGLGAGLSGGYLLLVVIDQPVASNAAVALNLASTATVAVLLGSFLGAVLGQELEGALLLFIVSGLQFMIDPASTAARFLPFWSTRELATYAVDGPEAGSLSAGLLHAAVAGTMLLVATATLSASRLRTGVNGAGRRRPSAGRRGEPWSGARP